jgi:hypothetical protein
LHASSPIMITSGNMKIKKISSLPEDQGSKIQYNRFFRGKRKVAMRHTWKKALSNKSKRTLTGGIQTLSESTKVPRSTKVPAQSSKSPTHSTKVPRSTKSPT